MMHPTAPCSCASFGFSPRQPLQRLVVVLHPIIDVDQAGGNVAVTLVGEVGGQARLSRRRTGIAGDRRLLQYGLERLGSEELQALANRRRIKHPESLDVRFPSPVLEPSQ